jgi:hypothetical protein
MLRQESICVLRLAFDEFERHEPNLDAKFYPTRLWPWQWIRLAEEPPPLPF